LGHKAAVVTTVGNSTIVQRLDARIFVPPAAAPKPAVVPSEKVVANPPIVRRVVARTMAMAISIVPSILETVCCIAVTEIQIGDEVLWRPVIVRHDTAVPTIVAAVDWSLEVGGFVGRTE